MPRRRSLPAATFCPACTVDGQFGGATIALRGQRKLGRQVTARPCNATEAARLLTSHWARAFASRLVRDSRKAVASLV